MKLFDNLSQYRDLLLGLLLGMCLLSAVEIYALKKIHAMTLYNAEQPKTHTQKVVTVDITGLTNNYIHELAKSALSTDESKAAIVDFSTRLESAIQAISRSQNVIVLPSQAVLAGAKDETNVVVELMKTTKDN